MKKILAIVLALAMVLGMATTVFALANGITDLVERVNNFPMGDSNAWVNENGATLCAIEITEKPGYFDIWLYGYEGTDDGTCISGLTEINENYHNLCIAEDEDNGVTIIFHLIELAEDDIALSSIEVDGYIEYPELNGKYIAKTQEPSAPKCNFFQKFIIAFFTLLGATTVVYFLSQLWGF